MLRGPFSCKPTRNTASSMAQEEVCNGRTLLIFFLQQVRDQIGRRPHGCDRTVESIAQVVTHRRVCVRRVGLGHCK